MRSRAGAGFARLLVALATLGTLSLCLYDLGSRSLWLDEGATYAIATQHGAALWHAVGHDGGNLALYYLLLRAVTALFGSGEVVLRFPSALAAAATVPLTYALGRRLAGGRVGLYAAAAVGFSLPLVYWGQMARGYTLGAALAAATSLAFVRARASGRSRDALVFALSAVALCYTLLVGALLLVVLLGSLALRGASRGARGRLALAAVGIGGACVPLGLIALHRGTSQLFWLKRPNLSAVRSALSFLAGANYEPRVTAWAVLLLVLLGGFVLVNLVLAVLDATARHHDGVFAATFALAAVIVVPLALYLVSRLGHPVFIDRYLSPCLPAAALLVALPLARLRPRALGLVALVALVALRLGQLVPTYGVNVDDWRDASAAILSLAAPRDCVAFDANDGLVDFSYYLDHEPPGFPRIVPLVAVLPADPLTSDPLIVEQYRLFTPTELAALPARCGRLFLVESHDGSINGSPEGQLVHAQFVELRAELRRAYASVIVRRYIGVSLYLFSSAHTAVGR